MENIEIRKIIYGDCLEEMKKMPDGSIDMIITDFMPNYINSTKTTYEMLLERGDVTFYARDGKIEESFTAIIKK